MHHIVYLVASSCLLLLLLAACNLFPYTTLFRSPPSIRQRVRSSRLSTASVPLVARKPSAARYPARTWGSVMSSLPFTGAVDRKSTRLNSSHVAISYAVFSLKKKNKKKDQYASNI